MRIDSKILNRMQVRNNVIVIMYVTAKLFLKCIGYKSAENFKEVFVLMQRKNSWTRTGFKFQRKGAKHNGSYISIIRRCHDSVYLTICNFWLQIHKNERGEANLRKKFLSTWEPRRSEHFHLVKVHLLLLLSFTVTQLSNLFFSLFPHHYFI